MELSDSAKILLAEKMKELFSGDINAKEYLVAVKAIYQADHIEDQSWEMEEYGFMAQENN